jgi:hypothetical protein
MKLFPIVLCNAVIVVLPVVGSLYCLPRWWLIAHLFIDIAVIALVIALVIVIVIVIVIDVVAAAVVTTVAVSFLVLSALMEFVS